MTWNVNLIGVCDFRIFHVHVNYASVNNGKYA